MTYPHLVKFNGVWYEAGQNVPNDNKQGKVEKPIPATVVEEKPQTETKTRVKKK